MRPLAFQVWQSLKINSLSNESSLRAKELFILLQAAQSEVRSSTEISTINAAEVAQWIKELSYIGGQQKYIAWFYKNLLCDYQSTSENEVLDERIVFLEMPAQVLNLIERYQTAANPLQVTNFGGQIYYERCLSAKIELLYQIGKLVGIINPSQTFSNCTKVTQSVQDVCNRVCSWVESNLGLVMESVNIYEPFIEDYKKFSFKRLSALKEIGVRSGLLSEIVFEDYELPQVDAENIIRWIDENYGIKLSPLAQSSIKSTNHQRIWLKATLLVIPIILSFPLGIIAYDYLHNQISPNQQEEVLEKRQSKLAIKE